MSRHTYNRSSWKRKKRKKLSKGLLKSSTNLKKNILLGLVACIILGSLGILGFLAYISRDLPNPNSLTERAISQTTKIYDSSGDHLLYEIFGDENRTLKTLQEGFCGNADELNLDGNGIPLYAVHATIAAEDRNFCEHSGYDIKGILRSVFKNIIGGSRVGGSTLTQQLVKNAILSNEKTYTRKIKELILSIELERRYSKDEILQIYLNEIPYGSTYYGIEAAAQNYYGMSVNELSLAQAATLAGIPKATTYYINNPDMLVARRNYILGEMLELGFITQVDHDSATEEDTAVEVALINIDAPHFVLYVKEQLEENYGQRMVEEGGMRVLTSLNYDMQMIAEEEVLRGVEENAETYGFSNASLVAIDPSNGHVLSMVGSKDYFDDEIDGQVNVATRLRQPGSSFKPIVYTKSFDMGYTPNTLTWDVFTSFPTVTGNYEPNNYDLEERGPVRLRDALQGSLNIPAVKMVYMVGVENTLDFATSLGYSSFSDHSAFGMSVVLGGGEVKLLEHTNAYATFANDGERNNTVSILKVEDAEGEVLEEWKETDGIEVIDKNVARTISHVLSDNNARTPFFGSGSYLQLGERPVAAKTGTTNDNRDAWLMGYTPSLAAGVWAGNNDNTQMGSKAGGSSVAGPIWNAFMSRALSGEPIETFITPNIDQTGKAVLDGEITSTTVTVDKASGLLATEYTPDSQKEERTYAQYHSLLHYVDRADPTGGEPSDPSVDAMYESWESAIQTWITAKEEETGIEILNEAPPTEYDDVHVPENFPTVSIENPDNGDEFDERSLSVNVNADAERGISRVEFYIDGLYLGSDSSSPFRLSATIPSSVSRGVHSLKAVAYDDVDNSSSDSITVELNTDGSDTAFEILDPKNGQTIERTSDTYTLVVSLQDSDAFREVRVYAEPLGGGSRQLVDMLAYPSSPFLTIDWNLPEEGTWALSAQATESNGDDTLVTAGILVEIIPVDAPAEETTETEGEEGGEVYVPDSSLDLFTGEPTVDEEEIPPEEEAEPTE
jgi:membrane peptidoglycan carboxypeptidase